MPEIWDKSHYLKILNSLIKSQSIEFKEVMSCLSHCKQCSSGGKKEEPMTRIKTNEQSKNKNVAFFMERASL